MSNLLIAAIVAFLSLWALLFVKRENGSFKFGFKFPNWFRGDATATGKGAHISKSTSTHGNVAASDHTGNSATITETKAQGDITAEVADAGTTSKKGGPTKDDLVTPQSLLAISDSHAGGSIIAVSNSPGTNILLGGTPERIRTFDSWRARHTVPPFDDLAHRDELETIVALISGEQRPLHVRVVGAVGVGKTRLVLEALLRAKHTKHVYYVENPSVEGLERILRHLATAMPPDVIVADECTDKQAAIFQSLTTDLYPGSLLLTIGRIENEELIASRGNRRILLQPMKGTSVARILERSTRVGRTSAERIATITGGFVKLALVVARAVEHDHARAFDSSHLVTIDIVHETLRALPGLSEDAIKWLGAISLFSEVRLSSMEPVSESDLLADFAGVNKLNVPVWTTAAVRAQVLNDRGGTVHITPALLAASLARELVNERKHRLREWLRLLPSRLQHSFSAQLGQLRYSDEGQRLAGELVAPTGPFGNLLVEEQPWAREAFLALGTVAKWEAIRQLYNWIRDVPHAAEDLASSRPLQRLLFRLIWRPDHFEQVFDLVIRGLGAVENPENGGLSKLLHGALRVQLSNSQLPFLDRLDVAREVFRRQETPRGIRGMILRAVATGVGSPSGDSYTDDDVDSTGRDFWRPTTWGDLWDCTRQAVMFLISACTDYDNSIRHDAAAHLIGHASSYIRWGASDELLGAIPVILALDPRIGILREELERCIAFENLSAQIKDKLHSSIRSLPDDLHSQIRTLVEGWPLVSDREEAGLSARPDPAEVAKKIIANADRSQFIALLFEPWAQNAGPLLSALASDSEAASLVDEILVAAERAGQVWGASVFLAIAQSMGNSAFGAIPLKLLKSENPFRMHVGTETLTRIEASGEELEQLSVAVRTEQVSPEWLVYATMGRWAERRPSESLANLIRACSAVPTGRAVAVAIAHAAEGNLGMSDSEIAQLLGQSMFDVEGHNAWKWGQLGLRIAARSPSELSEALLGALRTRAMTDASDSYQRWPDDEASQVLNACVETMPSLAGDVLELWDVKPYFVEHELGQSILGHIDASTLVKWASNDERQRALGRLAVPLPDPLTAQLIEEIGPSSVFGRTLRNQLAPRSWSGSLIPLLTSKAELMRNLACDTSLLSSCRRWALDAAAWLERGIELERSREARDPDWS